MHQWTGFSRRPYNVYTATLREDKDTDRHDELTGLTGCGVYSSTNRQRAFVDRPVSEWAMIRSGMQSDFPCHEHSGLVDRQAAGSVVARGDKDTKFPSAEHLNKDSDIVDRPVMTSMKTRSGSESDCSGEEHS